ncbi:transposase [Trichococcus flocculiformis]|nr:transposase [Trichococcus flocculiformis]
MYSYEERIKAVKLYIKYEHSLASVIQELGYPSSKALYIWFKEYEENVGPINEVPDGRGK